MEKVLTKVEQFNELSKQAKELLKVKTEEIKCVNSLVDTIGNTEDSDELYDIAYVMREKVQRCYKLSKELEDIKEQMIDIFFDIHDTNEIEEIIKSHL